MMENFARLGGLGFDRTRMRACFAVVLAAVLGGCASTQDRAATPARIGPDLQFVIPGLRELNRSVDVVQQITARYRDRTFVFEGRLSASPEQLRLVGLDALGRRALSIVWEGDRIGFDPAPWLPDTLKPDNILADIAIVYWPEEAVRRGLAGSEAVRTDQHERSISMRGNDIITVTYDNPNGEAWAGSATYRNIAFGYELNLRSVAVEQ
jgi:hypothetical protein